MSRGAMAGGLDRIVFGPCADPSVRDCRHCGAPIRMSAGRWRDIDPAVTQPWRCSTWRIASPLARHAPREPS